MKLDSLAALLLRWRIPVLIVLAVVTAGLMASAARVQVKTNFADLTPSSHPYVKINEQFKSSFGSSNLVSIMLTVDKGDIFQKEVLEQIKKLTLDLQQVQGVNQFQIISLASKKLKEIHASSDAIEAVPVMFPNVPETADEIAHLRQSVINNSLIYGRYVSRDLKSALITVDFIDGRVDYDVAFAQIRKIVDQNRRPGETLYITGDPMLFGWIRHYLGETVTIFLSTLVMLAAILFVTARTWRGTLLPLGAGLFSAVWALGVAGLLGFNFDPLIIVVAFLISARAISHSVQFIARFEDEAYDAGVNSVAASRASFLSQFQPGVLGLVVDAGGMAVVALTPIPLLQKAAIIGCVWIGTIFVTCFILTPTLLSFVRDPKSVALRVDIQPLVQRFLGWCARVAMGRRGAMVLVAVTVLFLLSAGFAMTITIGDARPGSPILQSDAEYNRDTAAINATFPGSDRMFVVVSGDRDAIKKPEVLREMTGLQRYLEQQPQIGGTLSIADIIPAMKQTLHEGNPRYHSIGDDWAENGELLYAYTAGSEPGDLDQLASLKFDNAAVTAFFRDRTGQTIRTAIARVKQYADEHPMQDAKFMIAGGVLGMIAAVNEVILGGQIEAIALALLVVVLCCAVTYRRVEAGLFFMTPVLLSNTLTFSFMSAAGIGMNLNTVPVAALGIGLGVDYSFYIVDRIREELQLGHSLESAIRESLRTSGWAVMVTAVTLSISVLIWNFSTLKFQAEMGLLIGVWLFISAMSAVILMPTMVYVLRPRFVVGE